jgi:hypothetical protein
MDAGSRALSKCVFEIRVQEEEVVVSLESILSQEWMEFVDSAMRKRKGDSIAPVEGPSDKPF